MYDIKNTEDLDKFFADLTSIQGDYIYWTGVVPKKLIINPQLIAKLARVPGFYQRPELRSEVTVYSPVVRHFKVGENIVTIREDYDELFMHFD